jgi:hypothetical protein
MVITTGLWSSQQLVITTGGNGHHNWLSQLGAGDGHL